MRTFQNTIKSYLDKRAAEDSLFATTYAKENKNIDECCAYITSQAKKAATGNCAVISDDVVFGWAVHYLSFWDFDLPEEYKKLIPDK